MKRYLALSVEELIDKFKVFGSILCNDDKKTFDVFMKYLEEDVKIKPRYELIKTKENLENYYHKYMKETPLSKISAMSFKEYLIKDDIEDKVVEKTCKNCRYCDFKYDKYYCIGQREAPVVRPIDRCDSFKYKVTDLW